MPSPMTIGEDSDNKKRKLAMEGARSTITNHFPVTPKTPTSPPILKEGKYSNLREEQKEDDTKDKVFIGSALSYLYVMIDIPSDRDHVEKYRIVLTKLLTTIRQADPTAVIMQYETLPKYSGREKEVSANLCIDHPRKMPRSITQLQKFFPKGRPKRGGGTVFTNILLLHNENIEDIILDMKDGMTSYNPKIGKQRIQHYNVTKLGYIMCLVTKIELTRWTEFLLERVEAIVQSKVMLAISVAKINDGTGFKDDASNKQA